MPTTATESCLEHNARYARGEGLHVATHPGSQPIRPARRLAVVACMDARMDVEDLLGIQTGDAHVIRNAGGVVTDDVIRCLIISHHLLDTNEIVLIHHTKCGMLAFTDDLLKAGLEGDPAATDLLGKATGRSFHARQAGFRGLPRPAILPAPPPAAAREMLCPCRSAHQPPQCSPASW